jgi:mRNA-degrading endonuclease RelE of RelBE toxin-antitoxin system
MKPGSLAEWELRIGRFRVFYDIDPATRQILLIAVGRKLGSRLLIRGQEHIL